MKKRLFIIFALVLFSGVANYLFSQDYQSGYYVPESPAIDEEVRALLENKIKVVLSEAGVTPTDSYYPVVTCVKYDEIETIEVPGIRTIYKTVGNVTLLLMFEKSQKLISAKGFKVEGSGTTREIAQKNAIDLIEISDADVKDLFSKATTTYKKEVSKMPKTSKQTSMKTNTKSEVKKVEGKEITSTTKTETKSDGKSTLSQTMSQSRSDVNEAYKKLFNKLFKK